MLDPALLCCADCGYEKTRFPTTKCPAHVSGLHRWSEEEVRPPGDTQVCPHPFQRRGWRFWLCARCYAPRSLHPRLGWRRARPLGDNQYLSKDAPHFKEGW